MGAGCGLLVGLIVGTYWYVTVASPPWLVVGAGLAVAAVAFAYGDRFWYWLINHAWWFQ